jgi:hypothetical protein
VDRKEVPSEPGVQDDFGGLPRVCVGLLVLARVKLDAAPSREKKKRNHE